ncbi:DUF5565 family protein [Streptosporangium sp. NPDC000239]|uniref:RNA ligase 1 family protein n=1 Tax=Streptosporangium sp. NPDC000239 TaxID=3154248 RepID=UPI003321DD27
MKKIPTVFIRDWDNNPKHVTREPNPECAWVFDGEGAPTVKWDGVCVGYLILSETGGEPAWYIRREIKPGKPRPDAFWATGTDGETGKMTGWEPIDRSGFAKYFREAVVNVPFGNKIGTYELVGPKINGNPDGFDAHVLMEHGWAPLNIREDVKTAPRDYDGLAAWLHARPYEGIVWHGPDGRMAKIKKRDFPAPTGEVVP